MAIQLIRLSQIKSNLPQFMDFEQQISSMFGTDDMMTIIATEGQQTIILDKEYVVGRNTIKVFVNGLLQLSGVNEAYTEINSRMISFNDGLFKDDHVVVIFSNLNVFATQVAQSRIKSYEIYRQTHFVTQDNQDVTTFLAPVSFQMGLNQLKVYVNGLLRTCGSSYDYVENTDKAFTFNKPLLPGSTVTAEVITGGLQVYKSDRFPVFIDVNKVNQQNILLPVSYKIGQNNLKVYLGGQLMRKNNDYIEVDERSFNMLRPLPLGAILEAEITTFAVDVFQIYRLERVYNALNNTQVDFTTIVPYNVGESNLRVYYNGVLLREGANEDYVETSNNTFKLNYKSIPVGSVIEYEIIAW